MLNLFKKKKSTSLGVLKITQASKHILGGSGKATEFGRPQGKS